MTADSRFPLCEEATDTPAGGGAGVETAPVAGSAAAAPSVPDDSDLIKDFKALTSGSDGDGHSAAAPEAKGSDGHPGTKDGAAAANESPAFGDELLDRARLLGVSDEVAKTFESPEELERTLFLMQQHLLGGQQPPQQGAAQQQGQQPPAQQPAQPQQPQGQQPAGEGNPFEGFAKKFRDSGDAELADLAETTSKAFAAAEARLNERMARFEALEQEMTAERSAQATEAFDGVIDQSLADIFGDVYGVKAKTPLTPAQFEGRRSLAEKVIVLSGAQNDRDAIAALRNPALVKTAAIALNHKQYEQHLTKRLGERSARNGSRRLIPNSPSSNNPAAKTAQGVDAELAKEFGQMIASQS